MRQVMRQSVEGYWAVLLAAGVVCLSAGRAEAACSTVSTTTYDAVYQGQECLSSGKLTLDGTVRHLFGGKTVMAAKAGRKPISSTVTQVTQQGTSIAPDHVGKLEASATVTTAGAITSSAEILRFNGPGEFIRLAPDVTLRLSASQPSLSQTYVGYDASNNTNIAPGNVRQYKSGLRTGPNGVVQLSQAVETTAAGAVVSVREILRFNGPNEFERLMPDLTLRLSASQPSLSQTYVGYDASNNTNIAPGNVRQYKSGLLNGPTVLNVQMNSTLEFNSAGAIVGGTVVYDSAPSNGHWKVGNKTFRGRVTITYNSSGTPTVVDTRAE